LINFGNKGDIDGSQSSRLMILGRQYSIFELNPDKFAQEFTAMPDTYAQQTK